MAVSQSILTETSNGSGNGKNYERFEKEQNNNVNQTLGYHKEPYEVGGRYVDENHKTGITATSSADGLECNNKDKETDESCDSPNLSASEAEENEQTLLKEDHATPDRKESKTAKTEIRGNGTEIGEWVEDREWEIGSGEERS